MSDIKPTKWLSDDGCAFDNEVDARQHSWNNAYPVYSQQAIDRLTAELSLATGGRNRLQLKWDAFRQAKHSEVQRLTAERDVLRVEKDRLQEIRQQLEAERDAAVAELARVKASVGAIHFGVRAGFSEGSVLEECVHAAPELAAIATASTEGKA